MGGTYDPNQHNVVETNTTKVVAYKHLPRRIMGKGAIPVATCLSPTKSHATTFTGLVMVFFFLFWLLLVYYLTASFVFCILAVVDSFSFFVKNLLGLLVVAFGTKELRFALRARVGCLSKGSNHVGRGPTVQDLHNDIVSFYNGSFVTLSLNRILRSTVMRTLFHSYCSANWSSMSSMVLRHGCFRGTTTTTRSLLGRC